MPKRKSALRAVPPTTGGGAGSRKKGKQRKPAPPPLAFPTRVAATTAEEAPEAPQPARSASRRVASTRLPGRDYAYVKRELQRIALTAGLIVVLLVVLSFVIR